MRANTTPLIRTLLVLGRVSNLPTVWSNCLAGWWLGGGGNIWKLPFLLLGLSLLYTGGMFLNDAFDAEFDRQRRKERPIPSGKISAARVGLFGFSQLVLGILLLFFCGKVAAAAAVILALLILLYDATHKLFTASPWLMGACRFWVYVTAGATGADGLNGFAIFGGAALALYVTGLSYVARRESVRGRVPLWPLVLLIAPVVLAMMVNAGDFRRPTMWISAIVLLWVARCVRFVFSGGEVNAGWIAANLLAGIPLVDWLAAAPQFAFGPHREHWLSLVIFPVLFGLTKWLQRFVPAT